MYINDLSSSYNLANERVGGVENAIFQFVVQHWSADTLIYDPTSAKMIIVSSWELV